MLEKSKKNASSQINAPRSESIRSICRQHLTVTSIFLQPRLINYSVTRLAQLLSTSQTGNIYDKLFSTVSIVPSQYEVAFEVRWVFG